MDDYVHCFMAYLSHLPTLTLSLPSLPAAVQHTLSALSCPAPETQAISLEALAMLSQRLSHAQFQPTLQPIFQQYGKIILSLTLSGVTQLFSEDGLDAVQDIVGATVLCAPPVEVENWAAEAINSIPGNAVPTQEKAAFLTGLHESVLSLGFE